MIDYATCTTDQIAAHRVREWTRTLRAQRRYIDILRQRFFRETDGRKLRRCRREYASAIDTYLQFVGRRNAWLQH